MARLWILLTLGVAAAIAGVAWYVMPPGKPHGYAGLEFSVMTPAAAARAPLLTSRGALIYEVAEASPADKAGLHPGEVVAVLNAGNVMPLVVPNSQGKIEIQRIPSAAMVNFAQRADLVNDALAAEP